MREVTEARRVFEKLVDMALCYSVGNPVDAMYYYIRRGEGHKISGRVLPGRLVEMLSAEEREALRGLTSEDTQDRPLW